MVKRHTKRIGGGKMTQEKVKKLLPIIQALAEGKPIQLKDLTGNWVDVDFINVEICNPNYYRIKPEPKYRPFANADECWQEMQKHHPFGWVKYKETKSLITQVSSICVTIIKNYYFKEANEIFTFADGAPFGIKEV